MTKIILIRHGQSIGNATKTVLGHTDLDLSELGYKQAKTTAEYLKNEKIVIIYSSDLKRAYNTAVPNGNFHNLEVIPDKKLREVYLGAWEGRTVDEIIGKWGIEAFRDEWLGKFGAFCFPEGESIADAGTRFYNEVLTISQQNEGKTVLIVAHAAVIRAFWAIISGVSWDQVAEKVPFASNASFSVAYFDGKSIFPDIYSYDEHLTEVGITKVKLI